MIDLTQPFALRFARTPQVPQAKKPQSRMRWNPSVKGFRDPAPSHTEPTYVSSPSQFGPVEEPGDAAALDFFV